MMQFDFKDLYFMVSVVHFTLQLQNFVNIFQDRPYDIEEDNFSKEYIQKYHLERE